ncbi:MAG: Appr-1-p processing protein, partial [Planctomycetota bacterium]|nr:Appr-1-p processing protein [Planctomycetota bacterium]
MLSIVLTALQEPLAEAWESHCSDLDCVSVYSGSIFAVTCDAVVSPANSFGFMDGGIDRLYTQQYGAGVQADLQDLIKTVHHGELLVGHAEIVPIPANNYARFLISAPTMRIPQ